MARVWEAHDEVLGRPVAVKILLEHLVDDASFVTRFRAEALAAARLTHPSVVSVYDTCSAPGLEAIVMELVDGETLRQRLDARPARRGRGGPHRRPDRRGPGRRPPGRHRPPRHQAGQRAAVDHRPGRRHRLRHRQGGRGRRPHHRRPDAGDGQVPRPRAGRGAPVDGRADVYALGVVLYEAVCGRVPFAADTEAATALARLHGDPPPPRSLRPDLDPDLTRVIERMPRPGPRRPLARRRQPGAHPGRHRRRPGPAPRPARRPHRAPAGAGQAARRRPRARPPGSLGDGRPAERPTPPGRGGPRRRLRPCAPSRPAPPPAAPAPAAAARPVAAASSAPPPPHPPRRRHRAGPRRSRHRAPAGRPKRRLGPTLALVAVLGISLLIIAALGWQLLGPGATETITPTAATAFDPLPCETARTTTRRPGRSTATPTTTWVTETYNGTRRSAPSASRASAWSSSWARAAGSRRLEITSPTQGWTAEVYVLDDVPDRTAIDGQEEPVGEASGIDGNAELRLGGREGSVVVLWITRTGDEGTVEVAEATVEVAA